MNCPICNSTTDVEIVTHSNGYAKNVMECSNCQTVWVDDRDDITIINKKAA